MVSDKETQEEAPAQPATAGPRDGVASEKPLLTLPLRRGPLWSGWLLFMAALVLIGGIDLAHDLWSAFLYKLPLSGALRREELTFFLLFLGLFGFLWFKRWRLRTQAPPLVITFFEHYLELPKHLETTKLQRVAYGEFNDFTVRGKALNQVLLLATAKHTFMFTRQMFQFPGDLEQLLYALQAELAKLPGGRELLAQVADKEQLTQKLLQKVPLVTQAICGFNIILFINMVIFKATESPLGLIAWGANVPSLIWQKRPLLSLPALQELLTQTFGADKLLASGAESLTYQLGSGAAALGTVHLKELFRLSAANFLHAHLIDLVFSLFFIYILGSTLERLGGSWRFLLAYLLIAVSSLLGTTLLAGQVVVFGQLPIICGLLLLMLIVRARAGVRLPLLWRRPRQFWVGSSVFIGLFVTFVLPGNLEFSWIPYGLALIVGGALSSWWLGKKGETPWPLPALKWPWQLLTYVLLASFVAGLAFAVVKASRFDERQELKLTSLLISDPAANPRLLNNLAWSLVTSAKSSMGQVKLAEIAAKRALELEPHSLFIRDTLAEAYYRAGKFKEAIHEELEVFAADPKSTIYIQQLVKYLEARLERGKALQADGGAEAARALKALDLPTSDKLTGRLLLTKAAPEPTVVQLELTRRELTSKSLIAYLLLKNKERKFGLVKVWLPPVAAVPPGAKGAGGQELARTAVQKVSFAPEILAHFAYSVGNEAFSKYLAAGVASDFLGQTELSVVELEVSEVAPPVINVEFWPLRDWVTL